MKLLFAGISGQANVDYTNHLFNCVRNPRCQREFFVPIKQWSDLMLYVDLPGKPETVESTAVIADICAPFGGDFNEDFNEDFDIGEGATLCNVVFEKYVIGKKPDGTWYGVFANPVVEGCENTKCFFVKMTFTIANVDYNYLTEQFCFPICNNLTLLKSCYPNETVGANASDPNGIYYGFPTNADFMGTENFRYFHWAYLRDASVIEQKNKLSFSAFNSKKVYKNGFTREWLLEFELVPNFYKNHILGLAARGHVDFGGTKYKLADEQDVQVIDRDSQLWKVDLLLDENTDQTFGCAEDSCVLPCVLPALSLAFEEVEGIQVGTFTGGTVTADQPLKWEIRDFDTNALVDSGTISGPPLTFNTVPAFDPATGCYLIQWRLDCGGGAFTNWASMQYGETCEEVEVCKTYRVALNAEAPDDADIDWTDCEGVDQSATIAQGTEIEICALEGTVSSSDPGNTVIEDLHDGCTPLVPTECSADMLPPFDNPALSLLKNVNTVTVSGTLHCLGCPCTITAGTHIARNDPSSPCNPVCNLADSSGLWFFGTTGYITYIGSSPLEIPCEGLDIALFFNEADCGEPE